MNDKQQPLNNKQLNQMPTLHKRIILATTIFLLLFAGAILQDVCHLPTASTIMWIAACVLLMLAPYFTEK